MSLQSTDPIADLLTRIRNAVMVGKNEITVPSSNIKVTVAKQLKKAGYVTGVKVEAGKPRDILVVTINNPPLKAWTPCVRKCRRHSTCEERSRNRTCQYF
jgi:ribosomal protein S8